MESQQQPWAATPASPAGQQPWAGSEAFASRLPIAHPWASSPTAYAAPLLYMAGRVRGKLSTYREGWICMAPEGMVISGKAISVPWLAENSPMRPRLDALPWDCVEEIVVNRRKGRIGLVYHLPDAPDKPMTLGLQLAPPPLLEQFAQVGTHYLGPEKVHEGKIKPPASLAQFAITFAVAFVIILVIVLAIVVAGTIGGKR